MGRKIAINGFGRIGRAVFRILENDADVDVVHINDLTSADTLAHLLKYDSVHGRFDGTVEVGDNALIVNGRTVRVTAERDPANLPWGSEGVELVLECTGVFRTRDSAGKHLEAGAKSVIVSAPAKNEDLTVVIGVNDDQLDPAKHQVVSCGSCTTNCLAPVVRVIDDTFGVESGLMTTIHSYTNDQRILDLPHSDMRRARAAAMSMIPTSTGAAVAVGKVLPHLNGKLNGISVRVPTPNVSLVDVVLRTRDAVTVDGANDALRKAAAEGPLAGILAVEDAPLVSVDYIGNAYSSTVDAANTMTVDPHSVKLLSWYDNEWGFSGRMVDLTRLMLGLDRASR
jgi:glyceraldehyde 3-phosphate dehydrogenase